MQITDQDHVLKVSGLAVETIQRMEQQVALAAATGIHSQQKILEMSLSLNRVLPHMVGTGFGHHSEVSRDGDVSLTVLARNEGTGSGFVYGVIFRPDWADRGQKDDLSMVANTIEGIVLRRYCVMYVEATHSRCGMPYQEGVPTCTGHDTVPAVVPATGTWSFHS